MNHPLLDAHHIIGWDIDGTCVEGPNEAFFCNYIASHPEKTHHLITFRNYDWAMDGYRELGLRGVPRERIAAIHDCPQHLWRAWSMRKVYYDEVLCEQYLHWKGLIAAKLGCTVLIDDMEDMVIKGCTLHGIKFVHAHDPMFG